MLGYNECQVLELFENTLPIRYYYLFGFQNLREAVESVKCVMIKEKLDKQLTGQTSTPFMSYKTHPYEKCKSSRFGEYKLLVNQTDGLPEVMEK